MNLPFQVEKLSKILSMLPSIGPKLSRKIAIYLVVNKKNKAESLMGSLKEAIEKVQLCENCGSVSSEALCDICINNSRDRKQIMVVEDSLDLINIESANEYSGTYHVLGGLISPMSGVGPGDLNTVKLFEKISKNDVTEVIIGLNPNLDGDSTSMYLKDKIHEINPQVRVTRLAKGIPSGADLEFTSPQTLVESMRLRVEF